MARPVMVSSDGATITTVREAVAFLSRHYNTKPNAAALNGLLLALTLAATEGDPESVGLATDQIEEFLGTHSLRVGS